MVEQNGETNREGAADDDGESNPVGRSIKRTFRQVSDDVKNTFNKVRRSFVDFWQDK
jgi:hypothetical protein